MEEERHERVIESGTSCVIRSLTGTNHFKQRKSTMTGRRRQRDELQIPPPSDPANDMAANTINPIALSMNRRKNKRIALLTAASALVIVAAGLFTSGSGGKDSSSIRRGLKVNVPAAARVTGYDARRKAAGMGRPSRPGRQRRQKAAATDQEQDEEDDGIKVAGATDQHGHAARTLLANRVAEAQQRELRELSENWEDLPTSRQLGELTEFREALQRRYEAAQIQALRSQPRHLDAATEARKLFQHIPKILHLVTINPNTLTLLDPDAPQIPPPLYWQPLIDYTRREAYSLGYKSKVWTLDEADELIEFQYDHLYDTWQRIKSTSDPQRISNFVRLVALHAFGGVYLDLDVLPCAGLDELVTAESGVASFPYTDPGTGYVWNGAISSPPVHRVIGLALQNINENLRSHSGHVDEMTGSGPIVKGLQLYREELGVGDLLKVYHREGVPVDGIKVSLALRDGESDVLIGRWYQSGVVRLGTFSRDARPNQYLSLWYIDMNDTQSSDCPPRSVLNPLVLLSKAVVGWLLRGGFGDEPLRPSSWAYKVQTPVVNLGFCDVKMICSI